MTGGIVREVQVNIPFRMLREEGYLALFLERGLNPEIGFDGPTLDGVPERVLREVAAVFHDQGCRITCHAPFLDLCAGSLDPAVRRVTRRRFEQTLRAVACLRPLAVVIHTGWDHRRYQEFREAWLERSVEIWVWFAEALRGEGARMMLENVYERRPEELLECCDALRELDVGICLDTGHLSAFGQDSLDRWLDLLMGDIGQLHLHDNHGDHDEHLAPGQGMVDFPRLLERMVQREGPRPLVTLEPHTEAAFHQALEYLERVWPWRIRYDSH